MSVQIDPRPTASRTKPEKRRSRYLWSDPAPRRREMSGALVFVIAAGLIAAVGMLYLLQINHVARLGYEMSELQAERQAAMVEQQQLQAELARLQAFNRIDRAARQDLGLRPMEEYVFLEVQAPEQAELEAPPATEAEQGSVWGRFWNRLTGRGSDGGESGEEAAP